VKPVIAMVTVFGSLAGMEGVGTEGIAVPVAAGALVLVGAAAPVEGVAAAAALLPPAGRAPLAPLAPVALLEPPVPADPPPILLALLAPPEALPPPADPESGPLDGPQEKTGITQAATATNSEVFTVYPPRS
jgi:hypothetical protein